MNSPDSTTDEITTLENLYRELDRTINHIQDFSEFTPIVLKTPITAALKSLYLSLNEIGAAITRERMKAESGT